MGSAVEILPIQNFKKSEQFILAVEDHWLLSDTIRSACRKPLWQLLWRMNWSRERLVTSIILVSGSEGLNYGGAYVIRERYHGGRNTKIWQLIGYVD